MSMPVGDISPAICLILGAAGILAAVIFMPHRLQWLGAPLALTTLLAAFLLTLQLQLGSSARLSFSGTWAVDDLTAWTSYIILGTTAWVVAFSPSWFASDKRHGEWYVMLLFSVLGALLMAGAADLMQLMVAMLLSSVTGYTLASYHRASRMCAEAGAKYYFLGALANPLMFMGIVLLYGLAGDTDYQVLATTFRNGQVDQSALAAGLGLVFAGLLFKLGAVPGHPWVPDVAEASPAPAAAFLTVVPKIAALAAIVRLVWLLPDGLLPWRWLVAGIAALTMSLGNLAALQQDDVRRLLGWSSVSQAGYGLLAVVAVGSAALATPALILFMVAYALGNVAAFGVVISLRGRTRLSDYQGLAGHRPWHAAIMTLALLSLTGIPPLIGFTAKFALFAAAIQAGFAWLALLAVINTVLSLFYYLRVVAAMYLKKGHDHVALLDRSSSVAIFCAAFLIIFFGLAGQLFFGGGVSIATASF